ncbi:hypothetical protein D9M68_798070 [compost metagenome]
MFTAFCCHCAPSPPAFGNNDDESCDRKSGVPSYHGFMLFECFSVDFLRLYGSAPPVMKLRTR